MDLDFIQEQLDTFSTFAGNIGDALQLIPQLLESLFGLFEEQENGESLFSNLSSETGDAFGDDEAGAGVEETEAGSSFGSSAEADAAQ